MISGETAKAFVDIFFPRLCPLCSMGMRGSALCICDGCAGGFSDMMIRGPLCHLCGRPFTVKTGADHTCGDCIKKRPPFVMARSVYAYKGKVRAAVHELKYKWGVMLGPFFGHVMAEALDKGDFPADIIVPVPLHRKRLRKRGFNQSVVLARNISRRLSIGLNITNLVRTRATSSQVDLTREQRRANMAGAFMVQDAGIFRDKGVVLVDDVFTTGATAVECASVLKRAGARVAVITLARVVY